MAKLTICLPVLNGADFVDEALRSLAGQSCRDFTVLAGNNGSNDATGEILETWAGQLPIDVLTQPQTIPMQAHFNLLLDAARTDYLMTLCHDDYFCSQDAVARALDVAEAHPEVSAIYCDLAYVSRGRRVLATRRFARTGAFDADRTGRECISKAHNMFGIPLLIRRSALGTLRYDPRFHYLMDVDLSWSLSRGSVCWHVPEVLIANRYRSTNATWGLLSTATLEYLELAGKYGIDLSGSDRRRITRTNWLVARKKQAFGLYERMVSAIG